MKTRLFTLFAGLALVAGLAQSGLGQVSLTAGPTAEPTTKTPDKAYMQKIWSGWATLNPENVAAYYATGPHAFFDITPVKYGSWEEYDMGVKKVLAGYKSGSCTVNDDAVVHPHGDLAWGTATVNYQLTSAAGKVDMGVMRWTVVWEKQNGKWLIVHEHVSEPLQ